MPGKDRTGPEGQGSRTGRQLGKCTPKNEIAPEPGCFTGRGMGRGIGLAAGRAEKAGKGLGLRQAWRHGGRC